VSTLRVALLDMQPRLRDILTDAVTREIDMYLLDCALGSEAELAEARPDVMVCEIEDPLNAALPGRLLCAVPAARVLAVARAGDHAALYELRPTCKALNDVSIQEVVDAIRHGLDRGHAWTDGGGPIR